MTRILLALLAAASPALAHLSYTGRIFTNFGGDNPQTITLGNVSSAFGWADATDADFGDSHRLRAFRFTLSDPGLVTISVLGTTVGAAGALPAPAFSIYSGLSHIAPDALAHDGSASSVTYLNSLGGVAKEGAFRALATWTIGNDDTYNTPGDPGSGIAIPASLRTLTYVGHAADGTAANYGSEPGIAGDGVADGFVTATFDLLPGDYTLMVGGGDYAAQGPAPYTNYGAAVTIVPEPSAAALLALGALAFTRRRVRGKLF